MFDLSIFKKHVKSGVEQVADLNNQIKGKQAELDFLRTSHPQRSDVINYFNDLIDRKADEYDAALQSSIGHLAAHPFDFSHVYGMGVISAVSFGAPSIQSVEIAILALFRDDIKTALRKRIEARPWPQDAGPIMADRPAMIEKAEGELADLKKVRDELRAHFDAARQNLV